MRGRRWLAVLLAVAIVGAIEALSDSALDEALPFPRDTILVLIVVGALAIVGGWLAFRSIDRLTEALERRNHEVEARAATTRALHQVGMAIAAMADLDAILGVIVSSARELLDADVALLARMGADGTLRRAAADGPAELLAPANASSDDAMDLLAPPARTAYLAAQLRRGTATVGVLAVGARRQRSTTVDDIETLSSLATQASIAIENARLQEGLREVAVRGERERIARELHDGLAQVLGYVNTKSQAVEGLLEAGRTDDARTHLTELASAARSVYVDVREAILGLSTPVVEGTGLARTIERYGERFAEASKLAVVVRATAAARAAELAPTVEAQAFRIVQEALTNVRKHASAHRVELDLDLVDGRLRVDVRDDGRGIGADDAAGHPGAGTAPAGDEGWPRYGLTSMRERAASAGASIAWLPADGGGTLVRLELPVEATPTERVHGGGSPAATGSAR